MKKAASERRHAQRRGLERAGVFYERKDLDEIAKMIREGRSRDGERQSNSRTVHTVDFRGRTHRVVYNRRTGQVLTFLDGLPGIVPCSP